MKRTIATVAIAAAVSLVPVAAAADINDGESLQPSRTCEEQAHDAAAMNGDVMPMSWADMPHMAGHDGPAMQALMRNADEAAMQALMRQANPEAMHAVMHGGNGRTNGGMP